MAGQIVGKQMIMKPNMKIFESMKRYIFTAVVAALICRTFATAQENIPGGARDAVWLSCGEVMAPDALIGISVAQLRLNPDYESPLETQSLMGTPVEVLDSTGYWRRIRVPDGYEAWVNALALAKMPENYADARKYIVTEDCSHVFERPSDTSGRISDIVRGDVLRRGARTKKGFAEVVLPSGRHGWVKSSDIQDYGRWKETAGCTGVNVRQEALRFIGVPYLWGGASPKGFDCSGLVQFSYYMNGMLLPRNATDMYLEGGKVDVSGLVGKVRRRPLGVMACAETALQAHAEGYSLDSTDYAALQPGDLLFFGNIEKDRPTHVGMYIGGGRFIHSSQLVRVNSLDPGEADCYENVGRLLGARKIIGR